MVFVAQIKYTFDTETLTKIWKGALIALGGVAGTYILEYAMKTDFGKWTPLVVAGIAIVINVAREFTKGEKP